MRIEEDPRITSARAYTDRACDSWAGNAEHCANCLFPKANHRMRDLLALISELQPWKEAVIDACVVDWVLKPEHETNPRLAVNDLLAWQTHIALDPAVSRQAAEWRDQIAALHTVIENRLHWVGCFCAACTPLQQALGRQP